MKKLLSLLFLVVTLTQCHTEIPVAPVAAFSVQGGGCQAPCDVTFTSSAQNAKSYLWDFDDNTAKSTEQNPKHTFTISGTHQVKLIVKGEGGSTGITQSVTILAAPTASIASFTFTGGDCTAPCEVGFTNTSQRATSYQWDFGDGQSSTDQNPKHTYTKGDTYTVKLTANGVGSPSSASQSVTIKVAVSTTATLDDAYASLRGYTTHIYNLELTSDLMIAPRRGSDWGGEWVEYKDHTWTPQNQMIEGVWNYCINGLTTVNRAIAQTPATSTQIIAQLRGLRGFYHFLLSDIFGSSGPPLLTESNYNTPFESNKGTIDDFVETDFKYAYDNLPEGNNTQQSSYGKITKWVGAALLIKQYVRRKKWADALVLVNGLVASSGYQLSTNMLDNFKVKNESSLENIFIIPYDRSQATGMDLSQRTLHPANKSTYNLGYQLLNGFCTTADIYNKFSDSDARKKMWLVGQQYDVNGNKLKDSKGDDLVFTPDFYNANGTVYSGVNTSASTIDVTEGSGVRWQKFEIQRDNTTAFQDNDFPIIRLADMLLLAAECSNELGVLAQAVSYVNMIRNRSGATLYGVSNQATVRTAIQSERALELVGEGWRRSDLIRWGIYEGNSWAFKGGGVKGKTEYMPIPQRALAANPKLVQNPGY